MLTDLKGQNRQSSAEVPISHAHTPSNTTYAGQLCNNTGKSHTACMNVRPVDSERRLFGFQYYSLCTGEISIVFCHALIRFWHADHVRLDVSWQLCCATTQEKSFENESTPLQTELILTNRTNRLLFLNSAAIVENCCRLVLIESH